MSSRHRPLLPLLLLLLLSSAGNSTDPSQCSSLLYLKRSFTSSDLDTWQPNTDCCRWDGVLCDPASGLVTALDLSHRAIAGKLTTGLFNITSLRKLNLAYNVFDEIPIPNEIGSLLNLTHLNLSNAGFVGQVPTGIAKLTNLVSLDLSTISLVELPQSSLSLVNPNLETLIGNLSELRELYLDSVNISANGHRWGAAVAKYTPKLTALSLTSCSITGPIDSSLSKLSNLSVVRLGQNELNCSVPDFFEKFSSLTVVSLSFCGLTGFFPKDVFVLKNLTNVDLSNNLMLSGSLPDFIDDSRLNTLVLSGSNFSGYLPNSIGKLKSLTRMDLSSCQFSGIIPFSIGNLSQLVHLDLSMNNFTGPIPSLLPPTVSELILSHNRLTGPIPSSIGKLEHAVEIDFRNNFLSGKIPASLFALPLLQEVQLSLNQLSEVEELKNGSSRLATVDLSNNILQGEIPRSVFQLSGLKVLTLASNNFSGIVEVDWFTALSNLSSLDLSNNRISIEDKGGNGSIPKFGTLMLATCNLTRVPSFLMHQDQMVTLDLSNNKIHGAIPNWIWNIGNNSLTYLNLSFNMFTSVEGPLPSFNKNTPIILDLHSNLLKGPIPLPPTNTIILDYSNNSFSSFIPPKLTSYLNFTIFFSLAHNNVTGEIPPSICNAINLQVLDFSDNNLNGLIPPCLLESYNELRVLNLEGNQLRGTIPWNISEGCGLRTINLNNNHLEGNVPKLLTRCSELEVLDLGRNHINGSFPFWLGSIDSLRVLVLRSNELQGTIGAPPDSHSNNNSFSALQIFDISSNYLGGPLPLDCFKNLKAMMHSDSNISTLQFEYMKLNPSYYQNTATVTSKGVDMTLVRILTIFTSLDFSNNSFRGNIPDIIGDFISLYVLDFSDNELTGNIPSSIGNLMQLESLDLSRNFLSGEIPITLSNLTFLSFLNLSSNNLIGRVPQGNQLSTFTNTSFEGNKGLCGDPLPKQCDNSSANPNRIAFAPASEVNWCFVFIGLGFGGGLAMVIGIIMFWEKGRNRYNKKVDGLLDPVLVFAFSLVCDYFGDRRVGAEEVVDCDSKEIDHVCDYFRDRRVGAEEVVDCDSKEIDHGRRFCVFCTILEFSHGRTRAHHVKCDCPLEGEN